MIERNQHSREVEAFLRRAFGAEWKLSLPQGSGHETYFASDGSRSLFVKLGAAIERVQAMARLGLTPDVLEVDHLEDGTSILVQQYVEGRNPGRSDYRQRLEQVANAIREMHNSEDVRATLPDYPPNDYAQTGLRALAAVRARWDEVRKQVPDVAHSVEQGLEELESRIEHVGGSGLVASHGDICNANWLLTPEGRLYLVDLDAMALDDPALDVGATLWWYYPEELWGRFLEVVGYQDDDGFRERMWARLALHCLSITLPRPDSFDRFDPTHYAQALVDFNAALRMKDNPQAQDRSTHSVID
ncbi:MAG TPA: aminoglycoside phosphotransferase family protein [Chloroflexia bacterium]|nr:aminoglycoside phosphotransferase family protein [Chloroflexia bacterium]